MGMKPRRGRRKFIQTPTRNQQAIKEQLAMKAVSEYEKTKFERNQQAIKEQLVMKAVSEYEKTKFERNQQAAKVDHRFHVYEQKDGTFEWVIYTIRDKFGSYVRGKTKTMPKALKAAGAQCKKYDKKHNITGNKVFYLVKYHNPFDDFSLGGIYELSPTEVKERITEHHTFFHEPNKRRIVNDLVEACKLGHVSARSVIKFEALGELDADARELVRTLYKQELKKLGVRFRVKNWFKNTFRLPTKKQKKSDIITNAG